MSLRLDRAFLRVSGPDAIAFLDNLVTQDLTKLDQKNVIYSALLTPQGKVVADMFLWVDRNPKEPTIHIEADPSRAADLMRRLNLYKLRARVAIEDATANKVALHSDQPFVGSVSDPRSSALNRRAIAAPELTVFEEDTGQFETRRIALGIPDLARDAQPEEVFAGEALLEELNGVAFDKGCFVGQENVSRMKRRATTRKKFCPIVFEGDAIAYGTPIVSGDAEIGSVRTGATGRAIALLRLDRAIDAVAAGKPITAGGREIRLDPPSWLILPQREDAPG